MEEEALIDAHKLFVQNGYKGDINKFKNLISTNPNALKDAHQLFVKTGYNKSIDDFSALVGVKKKSTSTSTSGSQKSVSEPKTGSSDIIAKNNEQARSIPKGTKFRLPTEEEAQAAADKDILTKRKSGKEGETIITPFTEQEKKNIGLKPKKISKEKIEDLYSLDKDGLIKKAPENEFSKFADFNTSPENKAILKSALQKHDQATTVDENFIKEAVAEAEEIAGGNNTWENVKSGVKGAFNTFLNQNIGLTTVAGKLGVNPYQNTDPLAEEKTKVRKELIDSGVDPKKINDADVLNGAKKLYAKNKITDKKLSLSNDFYENLDDKEKEALELKFTYDKSKLTDEDNRLIQNLKLTKARIKDLTFDAEPIKDKLKNKEQISPEEFKILEELDKQINLQNDIYDDYQSNSKGLLSAAEELDLVKREYGEVQNLVADVGTAGLRIGLGALQFANTASGLNDETLSQGLGKAQSELEKWNQNTFRKNTENFNNVNDGINFVTDLIGNQAPNLALMIGTGGGSAIATRLGIEGNKLAIGSIGAYSYGNKKNEMIGSNNSEDLNNRTYYSNTQIELASILYGGSEMFETATLGSLGKTKRFIGASLAEAPTRELFRKSIKENIIPALKSNSKDVLEENIEEQVTNLIQNYTEINVLGRNDVGLFDNAGEVLKSSTAMALLLKAPQFAGAVAKKFQPKQYNDVLDKNAKEVLSLMNELKKENLTPETKKVIDDRITKLSQESDAIVKKTFERIGKLPAEQIDKVVELEKSTADLRAKAEAIQKDESLSKEMKENLIKDLSSQYKTQEDLRTKIVSEKATILDILPENEVNDLKKKAVETLLVENAGKNEANFTEEIIDKKAIELYNQSNNSQIKKPTETNTSEQVIEEIPTNNQITPTENEAAPSQDIADDGNIRPSDAVVDQDGSANKGDNQGSVQQPTNLQGNNGQEIVLDDVANFLNEQFGAEKPVVNPTPTPEVVKEIEPKAVKVEEAPKQTKAQQAKGFVSMATNSLATSLKDFQGRSKEYSEQTYNRIVNEAKEGILNISSIPPIQIWRNPDTGKFTILAGHSRTKAFSDLASGKVEFSDKYKKSDFENINSQIVEAETLEEAQKIAQESNQGAVQTVVDNAKYVRESLLPTFKNFNQAKTKLKSLYGSAWARIYAYANLNPKGKAMQMLKQFQDSNESDSDDKSKRIAEWTGKARNEFENLTDAHENEIFDYLLKNDKVKTYAELSELLNRRVNGLEEFNPNEPLNFEQKVGRGSNEVEIVKQIQDLKSRDAQIKKTIKDLQSFGKNLNDTQRQQIKDLTAESIKINTVDIPNAQKKQKQARAADAEQFDIFSQINEQIENGNITPEQVDEFVNDDRKAEEIEPIVEVIESKAKGYNKAELEEVVAEVDAVLENKQDSPSKQQLKDKANAEVDKIADKIKGLLPSIKDPNLKNQGIGQDQLIDLIASAVKNLVSAGIDINEAIKQVVDSVKAKFGDIDIDIEAVKEKVNPKQKVTQQPINNTPPKQQSRKPIDKESIEKDSFEDMAGKMPNSGIVGEFLSGKTTEKTTGDAPEGNQEYDKIKLIEAFAHGKNIINKAIEQFGDNYVASILDYIENYQLNPENIALAYISLENHLRDMVKMNPTDITIKKQFDLVQSKRQNYAKSVAQAMNMAKLQNMAYYGYDLSETVDLIFTESQLETKRKIERAIQASADDINNEAEFQENEAENDIEEITIKAPKRKRNANVVKKELDDVWKNMLNDIAKSTKDGTLQTALPYQKQIIAATPHILKATQLLAELGTLSSKQIIDEIYNKLKGSFPDIERSDVVDIIKNENNKPKTISKIVKKALIDAGFGREVNITKKDENGNKVKEKRNILDWKKLAGEEGSVENIKKNVEETLKKQGYSEQDIKDIQTDLETEYTNLRASIIEKSLNELERRNTPKNINAKAHAQRLAELYNLGLFENDASEYDKLLNGLLGMNDFDTKTYEQLKQRGKALSELYATGLDPLFISTKIDELQKQINDIVYKFVFKNGPTKFKVVAVAQEYMNLNLRMMLHSMGQIIQNPYSGVLQVLLTKAGSTFTNTSNKELRKQRNKVALNILNDITGNAALSYGNVESNFTSHSKAEDILNKKSDNRIYHRIISAFLGKLHLEAIDSWAKSILTSRHFTENIIKILTDKSNPNGTMSKKEALRYVTENLTGQSFEDAMNTAREIIIKVNEKAGKNVISDKYESVVRLADGIVKHALVSGGKITTEQLEAAATAGYVSAGFSLGHEANNIISKEIGLSNANIDKKIKEAVKEKNYTKATLLTWESIFIKNIMRPFVGGGSNWIILTLQKSGLDLYSLNRDNKLAKSEKIELDTVSGNKNLKNALLRKSNAKNTNVRMLFGAMSSIITFLLWYDDLDDEEKDKQINPLKKWLSENGYAKKYFNYISPTVLGLIISAENEELGKEIGKILGIKSDYFQEGLILTKAVKKINESIVLDGKGFKISDEEKYKSAKGDFGKLFGSKINTPLPWRSVRDVENFYRGINGLPEFKTNYKAKSFTDGLYKGGFVEYLKSNPDKPEEDEADD